MKRKIGSELREGPPSETNEQGSISVRPATEISD